MYFIFNILLFLFLVLFRFRKQFSSINLIIIRRARHFMS